MTLVLDASITLAWYFDDERTDTTDAILDDVAYLELAQRRRVPWATMDTALRQAARLCDVTLLGT